jgi:CO/xanthine dehydrogenase FAD-binding subunit
MKNFEFASPRAEAEAVALLNGHGGRTAVLAGGTDLIGLLQADLVAPERVVDIRNVQSMSGVREEADGMWVGALTTLDEVLAHPLLKPYVSLVSGGGCPPCHSDPIERHAGGRPVSPAQLLVLS